MTPDRAVRVGELRPSQLLWSFGVGATVDLPHLAVLIAGLDEWDAARCRTVTEERLLRGVRAFLGPQVDALREAPLPDEELPWPDPNKAETYIGVPVTLFPTWLRCPLCGLLAEASSGLFALKPNPYRADRTKYVHDNCSKGRKPPTAISVRFLTACPRGHLDEFPWRQFVHGGPTECRGQLRFYEVGASLETANLMVECRESHGPRSMAEAFRGTSKAMPKCRGRHPHLHDVAGECPERLTAILLGASNTWFPKTFSALAIPAGTTKLEHLVEERWAQLKGLQEPAHLAGLRLADVLGELGTFSDEEIWDAITRLCHDDEATDDVTVDMKSPEWEMLVAADPARNSRDFELRRVGPPPSTGEFSDAVVVDRIREVNALVGFSRLDSHSEFEAGETRQRIAPLARRAPTWVPATAVRGEGIFLRFDVEQLAVWEASEAVKARAEVLARGHECWRAARHLSPDDGSFPGPRAIMIHTFSHLLMRQLALECGYSASSVRERVYATGPETIADMAGLLIYTAAADSEGTLGGLARLGQPEQLDGLVLGAIEEAALCASDPLCSEHDPIEDRTLHGAACHACSFAPETACEFGNRHLDRALVVPTLAVPGAAFFELVAV